MKSKKIIYYYQSFKGLDKLINMGKECPVTHLHLSAIHFGTNKDGSLYIHLNDNDPESSKFTKVWQQCEALSLMGVKIILMIGGAGSAFQKLFSNFTAYYNLLKNTILKHNCICGIDLDVEEIASLENIETLIHQIKYDFGSEFIISMAPVSYSMINDNPGMGGFCYKDLLNSNMGAYINYFNVQCYGDFGFDTYDAIIKNGYEPSMIVMGMISSDFNKNNFSQALTEVAKCSQKYSDFGGVYDWEYYSAPPNTTDPSQWCLLMKQALYDKYFLNKITCIASKNKNIFKLI